MTAAPDSPTSFAPGKHPRSIAALNRAGRKPLPAGQGKEPHTLSFSAAGWQGLNQLATAQNRSTSSLADLIGQQHQLLQMPLGQLLEMLAAAGSDGSVLEQSLIEIICTIAAAQRSA